MTDDEKKLAEAEHQRIVDKYNADAHYGYQKLRTMPDVNLKNGLPMDAYTNQPHPVRENCSCVKCVAARGPQAVPAVVPVAATNPHPFSATCKCETCAETTRAVLAAQGPAKNKPGRPRKQTEVQPEPQGVAS